MERKNYLLILCVLLLSIPLQASFKTDIYQAYIQNDMSKWKTVIDNIQKKDKLSDRMRLSLINYQYGYIGYCIGVDKDDEAENYLEKAWEHIEYLEDKGIYKSEVQSYRSAFYGFEIGLAPAMAPFYGSKSSKAADKAKELDASNPNAHLQLGNIKFYSPAAFGGSKSEAIEHYLKALKLMEQDRFATQSNWNYLSLLTIIAKAYEATGDNKKALYYYQKALKAEPQFLWVKDKLLPELQTKIKQQQ